MARLSSFTGPLSLREVLPEAKLSGDVRISGCSSDSRQCQSGDVFVAVRGTAIDGHEFAAEAVAKGAIAVVAERPLDNLDVPVCLVPDSREALALVSQAVAGWPSQRLRVIGVTGTNGKTTTTHLVASVLEAAGYRAGLMGTLAYFDGLETSPAELTTPDAPTIADWLRRMVDSGCTHAVLEVSSHAIGQQRIAGIELAAACLTNLRRDHLDYHGSLAEYHRTKSRIFQSLGPAGVAVINADDPAC
jgi:UDP-N-acetylmuramoyl-L-alanyl-D-glutamate--2,6-diaminopimelate ligase